MAQENFNVSLPNDGLGDALRDAFIKQQSMNTELYTTKVDKVVGKDLSTNDFTNALKSKLDGIENFADVNVQSDWLQTDDTADDYIKNKPNFAGLVPDGFTLAETTLIDQEFTINAAQWYVNGQLNILPFSFPALSFEIPLAGTGLQRLDLFYGTNVGTIERIEGDEATVAVEPTLPPNSVRLTVILTNDTASAPPPPPDLSGFIQKNSFAYLPLSSLGGAPVAPASLNFVTTDGDGVTGFSGFQSGSVFIGQRMIIRNDKTTDFELTPAGLFDFTFDQNYTIKAGDNIEFDFTASGFRQVGGLGVTVHNDLDDRDATNAHPIGAITGLQTALDVKQNNSIYITANTTALNNARYIANGTLTVSDIASPVAGSNYEVVVRGGSVTIGGQAYSEGVVIHRIHNGTSWASYVFDSFGTLTITFVANSTISTANSWQGKLIKINTNGFACVLQLNHKVDFVAGKYNGGTVEIIAGTQTRVLADNQFILTGNYDTLSVVVDPSDDTKSVIYTTIR